jgi:hypothetical protein
MLVNPGLLKTLFARQSAQVIEAFLWYRATSHIEHLGHHQQPIYAICDERVWEKPESLA